MNLKQFDHIVSDVFCSVAYFYIIESLPFHIVRFICVSCVFGIDAACGYVVLDQENPYVHSVAIF